AYIAVVSVRRDGRRGHLTPGRRVRGREGGGSGQGVPAVRADLAGDGDRRREIRRAALARVRRLQDQVVGRHRAVVERIEREVVLRRPERQVPARALGRRGPSVVHQVVRAAEVDGGGDAQRAAAIGLPAGGGVGLEVRVTD